MVTLAHELGAPPAANGERNGPTTILLLRRKASILKLTTSFLRRKTPISPKLVMTGHEKKDGSSRGAPAVTRREAKRPITGKTSLAVLPNTPLTGIPPSKLLS